MHIDRLNSGERISAGSAVLLFVFMFFRWYGLGIDERPNLLLDFHLFEDGGNAWQTLEVTPIFLALVTAVALGAAVWRLIGQNWEPPVSPGAVVCVLGAVAACLILIRIVFPPDLGGEFEGFTFGATLKAGIFLALAAACGIAYGGRRAMQEEGVSFTDLRPLRNRKLGRPKTPPTSNSSAPPARSGSVSFSFPHGLTSDSQGASGSPTPTTTGCSGGKCRSRNRPTSAPSTTAG